MEKRIFSITTDLKVEVRKAEVVESTFKTKSGEDKVTRYIDLAVDDMDDNRIYLVDKDVEKRQQLYQRGTVGTFKLKIDFEQEFGTKAKIHVLDFVVDKKEKK